MDKVGLSGPGWGSRICRGGRQSGSGGRRWGREGWGKHRLALPMGVDEQLVSVPLCLWPWARVRQP